MTAVGTSQRVLLVAALLIAVYLLLLGRLAWVHLVPDEDIKQPSPYALDLPARRGTIVDRNGNPLATELPTRLLFVDPHRVPAEERSEVAANLLRILPGQGPIIHEALAQSSRRFIRLAYLTDSDAIAWAETNRVFRGRVGVRPMGLRHYPLDRQLCHVLGFVNHEQVGSAGIEARFNSHLGGTDGRMESLADVGRRELREHRRSYVPPRHGSTVELTIDQTIQHHVEVALDRAMEQHRAAGAWAIVLRVRTGEVLAMAARPDTDPAAFQQYPLEAWRNRAISYNYEPGSVMKALTIAAALNEGHIRPDTVIDCEQGVWHYAGRPLRDKVRGPSSITTILQKSSNIGTAKIALMLGNRGLEAYLRLAGFGTALGIELPGEEAGILHPSRSWPAISVTRIAIGQGISVTGLQLVSLYAALANDGQRMQPWIVRRVVDDEGRVLLENRPRAVNAPLVSAQVARQVTAMLEQVTLTGGTGRRAAVPGYRVAGKTGTAQVAVRGGYSTTDFIASFVGYLPVEAPEIAILVTVDRPRPLTGGGVVAAPVFAEIAQQAARYLEIPPSRTATAVSSDGGWTDGALLEDPLP